MFRQLHWFQKMMFIFNIMAVCGILFSYLAGYIRPDFIWWLGLFALGYGTLLVTNVCFIIYWLFFKKKFALFSLIAVLLGTTKIFGIYQLGISNAQGTNGIKVMTYNVRLFDLYNWMHNNKTRSKIYSFLKEQNNDIICFQEFYTSKSKALYFDNTDTLQKFIKTPYSYIIDHVVMRGTDRFGMAIYSRLPIVNEGEIRFFPDERGGSSFMFIDVLKNRDTIRVFNIHLESVRFRRDDYKFINNLGGETEQDELKGFTTIFKRLKRAFEKRGKQIDAVRKALDSSPHPMIVCGDFNDVPNSYSYTKIASGLSDAYHESGRGLGKTYSGAFPSFRIDYILHSKSLKSYGYETHTENLSDHYAVSCFITN